MKKKKLQDLLVQIIKNEELQESLVAESAQLYNSKGRRRTLYFLGDEFKSVYFTQREAECMLQLLRGKNIEVVAEKLHFSPHTVEFYIKNMCKKVSCNTVLELVKIIKGSNFFNNYRLNYG